MLKYYENLFDISTKMLNFLGSNPLKINSFKFGLFSIFVSFYSLLILLDFFYNPQISIDRSIELLRSGFIAVHVINKMIALIVKRVEIQIFCKNMEHYWPVSIQQTNVNDTKFEKECLGSLKLFTSLFKSFVISTYCIVFILTLIGVLYNDPFLVFYVPKNTNPISYVLYSNFTLLFLAHLGLGVDILVSSVIILLAIQFKILNKNLSLLKNNEILRNEEEALKFLKNCIVHHDFLLRYEL